MAHILAIRFSAMGDVAMTLPVLYAFARTYPQHTITLLSRKNMARMPVNPPSNLHFKGVDLNEYKGVSGLWRLYRELKSEKYDAVADLHDVLRTKVLRTFFRLFSGNGTKVRSINKGRAEKRALTRKGAIHKQLPTSFERYTDVLARLGYTFSVNFRSVYEEIPADTSLFLPLTGEKGRQTWVGVAPFAAHRGKIYPIERMEQVVASLSESGAKVFLFGGGKEEEAVFDAWTMRYANVLSVAGRLRMNGELALMHHLDVMLCMDSGNMHLASLAGTPVVSVWGATHRFAGFMGWGQRVENVVETDLPCRPCSIFGDKPCARKDYACLYSITPEQILAKLEPFIHKTADR